jgi:hypothetical protein
VAFVGGGAAHLLSWAVIEMIAFPGAMGSAGPEALSVSELSTVQNF